MTGFELYVNAFLNASSHAVLQTTTVADWDGSFTHRGRNLSERLLMDVPRGRGTNVPRVSIGIGLVEVSGAKPEAREYVHAYSTRHNKNRKQMRIFV